jgi:flagellar biosynthesis protein FlhG
MVSTVYGPGVALVTFEERVGGARAPSQAPSRPAVPVVAFTSGKGGVGKTSLSVNLAIALQQHGCRTCLVDADLGLANADVLCGINPLNRLDAVVEGSRSDPLQRRSMDQIAIPGPGGFRLVPGAVGVARFANLPAGHRQVILDGLADLATDSDLVLVDTGAGLGEGVLAFVVAADLAVVVATPEPTSIADAYAMIKCIVRSPDAPRVALLVNQCHDEDEGLAVHARIAGTARKFLGLTLPMLGAVRSDDAVRASVRARKPFMLGTPRARASRDVASVATRLARLAEARAAAPSGPRRGLFGWLRGR